MKLSIGFSPCPNDTFIFDALVNGKIDTGDLKFEPVLEDVETLNEWALQGKLDITKLSFPAFFRSVENYVLMDSGSALGKGVGPLLVAKEDHEFSKEQVAAKEIALPGINTTAHLLFSFAYPNAGIKKFMRFDKIEDYVIKNNSLGVIIHENRFTYQQKGLHKVLDLGEYWETKMNSAIPLGGISIKRSFNNAISKTVASLIRKSLEFAFTNYPLVTDYVKSHSQSMSEEVMRQHIDLYVNEYSLSLGETGHRAIQTLFRVYLDSQNPRSEEITPKALFLS
jgi:1,4-dihydroxy-6-naphthoate synthase